MREDAGLRAVAFLEGAQYPQRGTALDLQLGVHAPEPGADAGLVEERLAVPAQRLGIATSWRKAMA